jgi:hypothetical protein
MKLTLSQIRNIINEEIRHILESDESTEFGEPQVEFPSWLEDKLKTVHGTPGQGSIFSNPSNVKNTILQLVNKHKSKIDEIAKGPGIITANISGIGYDLVISLEEAKKLPNAVLSETEKVEGPNKITVPMVKTSAPISQFSTDQLTVVVRPKKDSTGTIIPNEYIILTAYPGKDLPRASEWGNKYAIIVPDQKATAAESFIRSENVLVERWQHLAGLLQ